MVRIPSPVLLVCFYELAPIPSSAPPASQSRREGWRRAPDGVAVECLFWGDGVLSAKPTGNSANPCFCWVFGKFPVNFLQLLGFYGMGVDLGVLLGENRWSYLVNETTKSSRYRHLFSTKTIKKDTSVVVEWASYGFHGVVGRVANK